MRLEKTNLPIIYPSQVIEDQEAKLESIISAKEELMKKEDEKLCEHIKKVEADNVEQDGKIQKSDARIDQLKDNHTSHSEILEAILKELKEKDKVMFSFLVCSCICILI